MKKFCTILLLMVFQLSCEKYETRSSDEINSLRLPGSNVWKLDKLIDQSTTYFENEAVGSNQQILDYSYSCDRPYNRLINRQVIRVFEGDTIVAFENRFRFNENFLLENETGSIGGIKQYELRLHYKPDGSWDGENTLLDGAGTILFNRMKVVDNLITEYESESPDGMYLYKYYYSRNNLKRRDLFLNSGSVTAALHDPNKLQALKEYALQSNIKFFDHEKYQTTLLYIIDQKLDQIHNQRAHSRSKSNEWVPIETTEYTYFDHLNPIATGSLGWPATLSAEFIGTSVNDPKTETHYALDENGNKIGLILDFRSELIGTLINKLPKKESYLLTINSFDPETNSINELKTKGVQEFIYQSGCLPYPPYKNTSY